MAGLWEDEGKQREWRIWDELDWRGRARSSQVGLYSVDILEPQRWTACLCAPSSVLGPGGGYRGCIQKGSAWRLLSEGRGDPGT